jgi:hypothetical protein
MSDLTFQLGTVVFGQDSGSLQAGNAAAFELPREGLPFEWTQKVAITDFIGGYRSAQALGEFLEPITWTGVLLGSNAETRSFALQKLESAADVVTLTYSGISIDGVVTKYKAHYLNQFEIEYTLTFEPLVDNSSPAAAAGSTPNTVLAGGQNNIISQSTAPASGYTFPATTQQAVSNLNDSINNVLQSSGNDITQASSSDTASLQNQITSIQDALAPLASGTDPIAASAASDLSNSLDLISSTLSSTTQPLTTQTIVDPDLMQLSTYYYGSPSHWQTIAAANPAVGNDPYPTGTYSLIIPQAA